MSPDPSRAQAPQWSPYPLAVLGGMVSGKELEANVQTSLLNPSLFFVVWRLRSEGGWLGAGPVHRGQGAGVRVQRQCVGTRVQGYGASGVVGLVNLVL